MAIDDNTTYGLTGAQIKELPGKIEAVKGLAKELTTADYNANSSNWSDTDPTNFNCIAMWKLDAGVYNFETGLSGTAPTVYLGTQFTLLNKGPIWVGEGRNGNAATRFYLYQDGDWRAAQFYHENGAAATNPYYITINVVNNLTSTSTTSALSAKQGKVLKDLVDSIAIRASGAPTTSTAGSVGTLYEDTTNGELYQCTDTTGGSYTWVEVGAGGSGPTVVQTTGTSTTDVMSQNATTGMVFNDPSARKRVQIGAMASSTGNLSIAIGGGDSTVSTVANANTAVAIGANTSASGVNSVALAGNSSATAAGAIALGGYSSATTQGEMNIGSSNTNYGYNSSNYRLLSGLYDPQSAHDAATKGYVDTQVGNINTALQTLLNGTGA